MLVVKLYRETRSFTLKHVTRNITLEHVGKRGLSAYQVWLLNGNTGTEEDFLESLKGEPGAGASDATTTSKGIVRLAGDLSGTADAPTVPGLVTAATNLSEHTSRVDNPHSVTKAQVGLALVDNTADLSKPISNATQDALATKLESIIAGTNISIDDTDPLNPVISSSGGSDAKTVYVSEDYTVQPDDTLLVMNGQYDILIPAATPDDENRVIPVINLTGDVVTITYQGSNEVELQGNAMIYFVVVEVGPDEFEWISSQQFLYREPQSIGTGVPVFAGSDVTMESFRSIISSDESVTVEQSVSGDEIDIKVSLNQDDVPDGTTYKQYSQTEKTKLAGIASGATVNDTDANLKNRANHTGVQDISTVTNLQSTLDLKSNISDIIDNLISTAGDKPLSANQGRILKGLIDTINSLLTSDDTTLDELQEIVDYIKINRDDLDNLSISSIAGLQAALDAKASQTSLDTHTGNTSNPHSVTKSQVGLGNVDNTSDVNKPVSTAQQTAIDAKVTDAIVDGVTTVAPSQNAVADALALKQTLDSDLTAIAALTTTIFGRSLLTPADAAAARTLLELGTAALVADNTLVHLTGTETISGTKTFSTIASNVTPSNGIHLTNKNYVDTQITANLTPDATSGVKGKIQLAGDLGGAGSTSAAPKVRGLDRVFNVIDYGALGDGSTNDNTAVTAAVAAGNATGQRFVLLFPQGYNFILSPSIEISSNTHIINRSTITLDPAYVNVTTVFKGIFRLGNNTTNDIVDNVEIEGGLVVGDCFSAGLATNSPTFNPNNHKYVCYIHSESTHRNVNVHDFKVYNIGSPITLEQVGGTNGTPTRNVHVYNIVEEQIWVGVQFYCNGWIYEDCSVHDIDVKYCYDDCVAIVGSAGGTGGTGIVRRIQVYNIRGEKSGQTGAGVKLDATPTSGSGYLSDIQVYNVNLTTTGVNEYPISLIGASTANNKKIDWDNIVCSGTWAYGLYAQTNGRSLRLNNFYFESLYGIHFQGNSTPQAAQSIQISHGVIVSRNASSADTIEGNGISYSASTGAQGFQNVRVFDVEMRNKSIPINEGATVPSGTGVQGTYANFSYDIDVRNSLTADCVFSSTNRQVVFYKEGAYQNETGRAFTTSPTVPTPTAADNSTKVASTAYVDAADALKQPLDADLTTIAGLTPTTDNFMVAVGSAWASRTPAQAKTSLALAKADVGLGNVDNTSNATERAAAATLTNKYIQRRITAVTGNAPTFNADNCDVLNVTAITAAINLQTNYTQGTRTTHDTLWVSLTANGSYAITWMTNTEASTIALPTTTINGTIDVGFRWNAATTKFRCIGVA